MDFSFTEEQNQFRKEVREFLEQQLPQDLGGKPVIGFATYLFFPARALNHVNKAVETRNGNLLSLIAQRRSKKTELVNEILRTIEESH